MIDKIAAQFRFGLGSARDVVFAAVGSLMISPGICFSTTTLFFNGFTITGTWTSPSELATASSAGKDSGNETRSSVNVAGELLLD